MANERPCNFCKRLIPLAEYPTWIDRKGLVRPRGVCAGCRLLRKTASRLKHKKKEQAAKRQRYYKLKAEDPEKMNAADRERRRKRRKERKDAAVQALANRGMCPVKELAARHPMTRGRIRQLVKEGLILGDYEGRFVYANEESLKRYLSG